jgi:hypothetical protein
MVSSIPKAKARMIERGMKFLSFSDMRIGIPTYKIA